MFQVATEFAMQSHFTIDWSSYVCTGKVLNMPSVYGTFPRRAKPSTVTVTLA